MSSIIFSQVLNLKMNHDKLSGGLLASHHPSKPLLAQETLWSGNVNHIRMLGGRDYTNDELRKNTLVIHFSAAALVFADNGGGNSSAGKGGTVTTNIRVARGQFAHRP